MREPSLQKTTALSFAIHITALLIAFLFLKQSSHLIIPPPYTVSLVGPEMLRETKTGEDIGILETARDAVAIEDVPRQYIKKKKEEEMAEERISAIAAKKKVERIVRLRSIISLKAGGDNRKDNSRTTSASTGKGTMFDEYYSKITREIWQQWVFPDTGQKDLEVIISIRIMKDGTVTAQRIEKSSGNPIFDRSAIKALTKASPLSPPPYEMEIGVRFYP
ncbi:MAG: TonB family protein [Nitrospirae bacterium]|nr:TonB family protein [Nitrospirota bacterium]